MFFDWISCYQDFERRLPLISDRLSVVFDTESESILHEKQIPVGVEGSFDTRIQLSIAGNRLYFSGNPSRWGRPDNLFGFETLDEVFQVVNHAVSLAFEGTDFVPQFTKNTQLFVSTKDQEIIRGDGVTITRLDLTSNRQVGQSNEFDYQRAISSLNYRNSIPHLYTNGCTVQWKTKKGAQTRLIDAKTYLKAEELELHLLPRLKRKYGDQSEQYLTTLELVNYCRSHGVVRFEQRLKHEFLKRNGWSYWGQFNESQLNEIHDDFLSIDDKLKVTSMDIESIAQTLISNGICSSTQSANSTASYAIRWMHGETFAAEKRQVQMHRARLRKIGMDIAQPCDLTRHSPVHVKKIRSVNVRPLAVPSFYKSPSVADVKRAA